MFVETSPKLVKPADHCTRQARNRPKAAQSWSKDALIWAKLDKCGQTQDAAQDLGETVAQIWSPSWPELVEPIDVCRTQPRFGGTHTLKAYLFGVWIPPFPKHPLSVRAGPMDDRPTARHRNTCCLTPGRTQGRSLGPSQGRRSQGTTRPTQQRKASRGPAKPPRRCGASAGSGAGRWRGAAPPARRPPTTREGTPAAARTARCPSATQAEREKERESTTIWV